MKKGKSFLSKNMFLLATILLLGMQDVEAQVLLDFTTNTTGDWQIELDGNISYDAVNGNSGGCLRVDDDASGVINLLVAPNDFLGDWRNTDTADYIAFDYLVHLIGGSAITNADFIIEISGPAGSAKALPNYVYDSLDTWENINVKLNPDDWFQINGNWMDILAQVDLVKIRSEFVQGDEYVLIDNAELSFSPIQSNIEGQVCSTFETLEGWSFINVASAVIDSFGRPLFGVKLSDQLNQNAAGFAPPKFRGNWTDIDTADQLKFDIYIATTDPDVFSSVDIVTISGNGNVASVTVSESEIDSAYNQWHRFSFPINENEWQVTAGNWTDLIQNVQSIRLELEFIIGTETVFFDNFCIGDGDCPKSLFIHGGSIDSTIVAQNFIILDSVTLTDQAIISAPEVTLKNGTVAPLGNNVQINSDGCN
jgi:hypothetical protein